MTVLAPYRATSNTLSDAVQTYLSTEHVVLLSMRDKVVMKAILELGTDWHDEVRNDPGLFVLEAWDQPGDAFYILKCLAKFPNSGISATLGPVHKIRPLAKRVFHSRNQWSHFSNQLVMSAIKYDVKNLVDFADQAGLEVARQAYAAFDALNKATALKPQGPAAAPTPASEPSAKTSAGSVTPRPRIGDPWVGDLPKSTWQLNEKLADVRSNKDGSSLRSRWSDQEEAATAIRRWFRRNLLPRVLHIDPVDDATVGFVEGHPYFLGYARPSLPAEKSQIRGFYEPGLFELDDGELVETDSGKAALTGWAHRADMIRLLADHHATAGDAFRVTDFGDVVLVREDGLKLVARLSRSALRSLWDAL